MANASEREYGFMMAEGEDGEEFLLRLAHTAKRSNREATARQIEGAFNLIRPQAGRAITFEQYDEAVHILTLAALRRVGDVEPSTEFVGYF